MVVIKYKYKNILCKISYRRNIFWNIVNTDAVYKFLFQNCFRMKQNVVTIPMCDKSTQEKYSNDSGNINVLYVYIYIFKIGFYKYVNQREFFFICYNYKNILKYKTISINWYTVDILLLKIKLATFWYIGNKEYYSIIRNA